MLKSRRRRPVSINQMEEAAAQGAAGIALRTSVNLRARRPPEFLLVSLSSMRPGRDLLPDPAAEQPLGIAVGDAASLILWQLTEPIAVFFHNRPVLVPAFVDPAIGAKQETVRMAAEEIAPFR